MKKLIFGYITFVVFCLVFVAGALWSYLYFIDAGASFLGKDGSLLSFASALFSILFGSGLIFGALQWLEDKKKEQERIFLVKIDEIFNSLYALFSKIEMDKTDLLSIRSFEKINYESGTIDVSFFQKRNISFTDPLFTEWGSLAFEFISILEIYRDLLKNQKILDYVIMKMMRIGNIRAFYLHFLYRWLTLGGHISETQLDGKITVRNPEIQKILRTFIRRIYTADTLIP